MKIRNTADRAVMLTAITLAIAAILGLSAAGLMYVGLTAFFRDMHVLPRFGISLGVGAAFFASTIWGVVTVAKGLSAKRASVV